MNPAHTTSSPGLAPCGMKMEPVYEGGVAGESPATKGSVRVSPDKKALMGVRTVVAQKQAVRKLLRWPAKIAAQQHRIYQINAPLDGRITAAPPGLLLGELVIDCAATVMAGSVRSGLQL